MNNDILPQKYSPKKLFKDLTKIDIKLYDFDLQN